MKEPTKARAASADKAKAASPPTPEARRERMAQSFADIVGVLMRDPGFRNLRLADLEWLVLPPILTGQWRMARGPATSPVAPTAAGEPTKGNLRMAVALHQPMARFRSALTVGFLRTLLVSINSSAKRFVSPANTATSSRKARALPAKSAS